MTLTLPYPPSVNHLYASVNGRKVLSRQGREYKATAGAIAVRSGIAKLAGPVAVKVDVYRPRRAGDLDNSLKAILDSLKGIAWNDDKQVKKIIAEQFDDKVEPRAEIEITPIAGTPGACAAAVGPTARRQ